MGRRERPLESGPLHDFARELRELRAATGLTYRALARKAGYSASALSAAASGDGLPTLDVLLAYAGACGADMAAWEQRWREVAATLRRTNPALLPGPIPGLAGQQPVNPLAGGEFPAAGGADVPPGEVPAAGTDLPTAGTDLPTAGADVPAAAGVGVPGEVPAAAGPAGQQLPGQSAAAERQAPGDPAHQEPRPGQGSVPRSSGLAWLDGLMDGLLPLSDTDPRRVGRVVVAARLGAGAMGQVYLGRTQTGEPVAVKVVRAELAEDAVFRRRFRRELHALSEVHSPYTGPLSDGDADAQRPWLATAYTPAVTLQEAVDVHGPLPPQAVCYLAAAVTRALAAIHAAGIVHRDLKPSNVLLTADGVQVIDFGIARAAEGTSLTVSGAHVGSAAFMAPEQATGGPVGPAADVFALGCLLAYALTGVPPFGEGRTEAVLYRVVHQPPDLSLVHALTSADNELDNLGQLINACLDKDPAGRPAAAGIPGRYRSAARTPVPGWLPVPVEAMVTRRGAAAAAALRQAGPDDADAAGQATGTGNGGRRIVRQVRLGLAPVILAGAAITAYAILSAGGRGPTQIVPDHTPGSPSSPGSSGSPNRVGTSTGTGPGTITGGHATGQTSGGGSGPGGSGGSGGGSGPGGSGGSGGGSGPGAKPGSGGGGPGTGHKNAPAGPPPAPTHFNAVAGEGCPTSGGQGTYHGTGWTDNAPGGSTANGCNGTFATAWVDNGRRHPNTTYDWWFHTGLGSSTCDVQVYIPDGTDTQTGGHAVNYHVYDGSGSVGKFQINQSTHRARWVDGHSYGISGGALRIEVDNIAGGDHQVAADALKVSCAI